MIGGKEVQEVVAFRKGTKHRDTKDVSWPVAFAESVCCSLGKRIYKVRGEAEIAALDMEIINNYILSLNDAYD